MIKELIRYFVCACLTAIPAISQPSTDFEGAFANPTIKTARKASASLASAPTFFKAANGFGLKTQHSKVEVSDRGIDFIAGVTENSLGNAQRGTKNPQTIKPSKPLRFDPQLADNYPEHKDWSSKRSQSLLRANSVWNEVDVVMHTMNGHFEFDVVLHPGSRLDSVWFEVGEAVTIYSSDDGSLQLVESNQVDALHVFPPYAFYTDTGDEIEVAFSIEGKRIGFALEAYDPARQVIIDPQIVASFQHNYGGNDSVNGVLFTSEDTFLIGGGYSNENTQNTDAVWSKRTRSGDVLYEWTLGGNDVGQNEGNDEVLSVAEGANLNSFWLGGVTSSSNLNGAVANGDSSGWFARFDAATGNSNLGPLLISGSGSEKVAAISVDTSGNAHVVGETSSTDLPASGWDQALNGNSDAFYAVFNSSGNLEFLTYIGGSGDDAATDVAFDSASNKIYITGWTDSSDFVTTNTAEQQASGGGEDGFVVVVNNAFTTKTIDYASYAGGPGSDRMQSVALANGSDSFYLAGRSNSTNFPSLTNLTARNGGNDAVLLRGYKIGTTDNSTSGTTLVSATYYGGSLDDEAAEVVVDEAGFVHLAGTTSSGNFPLENSLAAFNGGAKDAFLLVTSQQPQAPLFSTYIGGSGTDIGTSLSVSDNGLSAVAITTNSPDIANCVANFCTDVDSADSDVAVVTIAAPVHQLDIDLLDYNIGSCPLITQRALVTDQHGFHYSGLGLSNFRIFMDELEMNVSEVFEPESPPVLAGIALDYSGSMSSLDIQNAEMAAKEFVQLLEPEDAGSFTEFDNSVYTYPATSDKSQLLQDIDSPPKSSGGNTALFDGMYSSMRELVAFGGSRARVVVALTDGINNSSSESAQSVINYASANNIRLFTIGLGNNIDEATLINLAAETGGEYQNATTSAGLTPLFIRALQSARERYYYITFEDSILDGQNHAIELRANEPRWGAEGLRVENTIDGTCLPTFNQALDISPSELEIFPSEGSWLPAGGVDDAKFDRDYAYSAAIANNEETGLLAQLFVPEGAQKKVTFAWKSSTEVDDILSFSVNGIIQASISGENNWADRSITLNAGSHVLQWLYRKDFSDTSGQDRVWVDYIRVVNLGPPPPPSIASFDAYNDSLTVKLLLNGTGGGTIAEYEVVCTNTVTQTIYSTLSSSSTLQLNNIEVGAAYDCGARVRNEFGWSESAGVQQTEIIEESATGLPLWLLLEATKD